MFRRNRRPEPPAPPPLNPMEVSLLLIDLATELYRSVVTGASAELHAELRFDEQQRVAQVIGLTVDGQPVLPTKDAIERCNAHSTRMASLEPANQFDAVRIQVIGGEISTDATYRENPPPPG